MSIYFFGALSFFLFRLGATWSVFSFSTFPPAKRIDIGQWLDCINWRIYITNRGILRPAKY